MADAEPPPRMTAAAPQARPRTISRGRLVLLFTVMLVTAAGNTAMQSVMPSIGTALGVSDVWISLAYSWSAILWVTCAPIWAKRSDRRGRKAMMALGLVGFASSMALCGIVLWAGLAGLIPALWTLVLFALCRSLYGLLGSAAPPAVQAYVASRTPRAERTQALSLISSSFARSCCRTGPALLIFPLVGLTGPRAVPPSAAVDRPASAPMTSRNSKRADGFRRTGGGRRARHGVPMRRPGTPSKTRTTTAAIFPATSRTCCGRIAAHGAGTSPACWAGTRRR